MRQPTTSGARAPIRWVLQTAWTTSCQIDVKVVRELNSVLNTQNADQGLQVAWADVNKIARRQMRGHHFRVRVWDTDDLTESAFRNYHLDNSFWSGASW